MLSSQRRRIWSTVSVICYCCVFLLLHQPTNQPYKLDSETCCYRLEIQVRRLDSDVHQIVYENYNKFLTATSSVRKIEKEFKHLDSVSLFIYILLYQLYTFFCYFLQVLLTTYLIQEMQSLGDSMSSISRLVKELSPVIDGKKGQVRSLL